LSRRENWYYNNIRLECVFGFAYVDMHFSNTLSLYKIAQQSAMKAEKVCVALLHSSLSLSNINKW